MMNSPRYAGACPWWVVVCANSPTCRLSGFSTFRLVGKLESWRGGWCGGLPPGKRKECRRARAVAGVGGVLMDGRRPVGGGFRRATGAGGGERSRG